MPAMGGCSWRLLRREEGKKLMKYARDSYAASRKKVVNLPWMPASVVFEAEIHHGFTQKAVFNHKISFTE